MFNDDRVSLIADVVGKFEGIMLNGSDRAIVADRNARFVGTVDFQGIHDGNFSKALSQIRDMLIFAEEQPQNTTIRFEIHSILEWVYNSKDVRDSVWPLFAALFPFGPIDLKIYFSRPPGDWYLFIDWIGFILQRHPEMRGRIQLWGSFDLTDDLLKEKLCQHGIRLGYTAGWTPVGQEEPRDEVIRDFARFGFRIPLVFFVTAGNSHKVHRLIETALAANEHSGFALPAAFHHPEYDLLADEPTLTASDYTEFLIKIFHDYRNYDDAFFPVSDVITSFAEGAWRKPISSPATIRLVLMKKKGIGAFRQVPSLSAAWIDWREFQSFDRNEITSRLAAIHRAAFGQSENPICKGCPWWNACGGVDRPQENLSSEGILAAACDYRKQFFPELLRFRADAFPLRLPTEGTIGNRSHGISEAQSTRE